jgi:hypothetical protein
MRGHRAADAAGGVGLDVRSETDQNLARPIRRQVRYGAIELLDLGPGEEALFLIHRMDQRQPGRKSQKSRDSHIAFEQAAPGR